MKVLVIVAHPDDETIWMGGTILKNKWDVDVLCLCRENDRDRMPKFFKVCNELKVNGNISDLEDENLNEINVKEIVDRIRGMLKCNMYDYIYTHGSNGEYGHIRHIDIHNGVNLMLKNNEIKCEKIFYFAYKKEKDFCSADYEASKIIKLPKEVFLKKKYLIREVYGFNNGSFEEKSCGMIEAFR